MLWLPRRMTAFTAWAREAGQIGNGGYLPRAAIRGPSSSSTALDPEPTAQTDLKHGTPTDESVSVPRIDLAGVGGNGEIGCCQPAQRGSKFVRRSASQGLIFHAGSQNLGSINNRCANTSTR